MPNTMQLLANALELKNASDWARELGLSRNALNNAKNRGHVSPAIAGAMAEQLGEDVNHWIVIAALESEKDSACKSRMLKRLSGGLRKLYLSTISAARRVVIQRSKGPQHSASSHPVSHAKALR